MIMISLYQPKILTNILNDHIFSCHTIQTFLVSLLAYILIVFNYKMPTHLIKTSQKSLKIEFLKTLFFGFILQEIMSITCLNQYSCKSCIDAATDCYWSKRDKLCIYDVFGIQTYSGYSRNCSNIALIVGIVVGVIIAMIILWCMIKNCNSNGQNNGGMSAYIDILY